MMQAMQTQKVATMKDTAANIAFFLLEKTGSVYGYWQGRMKAKEQREIFGRFIGKGMLHIDGEKETVEHTVKVCFGLDYDTTYSSTFAKMTYNASKDPTE